MPLNRSNSILVNCPYCGTIDHVYVIDADNRGAVIKTCMNNDCKKMFVVTIFLTAIFTVSKVDPQP